MGFRFLIGFWVWDLGFGVEGVGFGEVLRFCAGLKGLHLSEWLAWDGSRRELLLYQVREELTFDGTDILLQL